MRVTLLRTIATASAFCLMAAPVTAQLDAPQAAASGIQQPAPAAEDRLARDDGRRTVGRFAANLARGTVGVFSTDSVKPLLIGGSATGIAFVFDHDVADAIADSSSGFGTSFEVGAQPAVIGGVVAILFATGRAVEGPRYRAMTYDWMHAFLINAGYTVLLKAVTRRERPNGEDHLSFPSGHASNAFALAAVAEQHYGWKAGVPAYTLAGLVAVSRLQRNAHYVSDVTAAATLGYIVGRTVVRVNRQPIEPARAARFSLSPVVTRRSWALVAGFTF